MKVVRLVLISVSLLVLHSCIFCVLLFKKNLISCVVDAISVVVSKTGTQCISSGRVALDSHP